MPAHRARRHAGIPASRFGHSGVAPAARPRIPRRLHRRCLLLQRVVGEGCSWWCRLPSPSRDCSSSATTPATAATPSTTGSTRSSAASHSCRRSRRSRSGTSATTLPITASPTSRAATRSGCRCRPKSGRPLRKCAAGSSASIARVSARVSTTPSKCGGRSSSCPARNTSACAARFSCGTTCWC